MGRGVTISVTRVRSSLMLNVTTFDCPGCIRVQKTVASQRALALNMGVNWSLPMGGTLT